MFFLLAYFSSGQGTLQLQIATLPPGLHQSTNLALFRWNGWIIGSFSWSVVNHSPLRGWHHDASNLKWTANNSRTDLILPSEALPNQSNHTVSLNKAGHTPTHTHTHFYNTQGPEFTCSIVMGVDLSGWLLGGLSQKIPKTNPKSWLLRQQCNTLNLWGSSLCYRVHTTWRTRLSTEDYRAVSRYIPLGCGRGGSCLCDIAALLQKGTSSFNIFRIGQSDNCMFFQLFQLGQVLINPISFLHTFDKWEDVSRGKKKSRQKLRKSCRAKMPDNYTWYGSCLGLQASFHSLQLLTPWFSPKVALDGKGPEGVLGTQQLRKGPRGHFWGSNELKSHDS